MVHTSRHTMNTTGWVFSTLFQHNENNLQNSLDIFIALICVLFLFWVTENRRTIFRVVTTMKKKKMEKAPPSNFNPLPWWFTNATLISEQISKTEIAIPSQIIVSHCHGWTNGSFVATNDRTIIVCIAHIAFRVYLTHFWVRKGWLANLRCLRLASHPFLTQKCLIYSMYWHEVKSRQNSNIKSSLVKKSTTMVKKRSESGWRQDFQIQKF